MTEFKGREEALLEALRVTAGTDSGADRYKAGYLAAIYDFLNIEIEEIQTDD